MSPRTAWVLVLGCWAVLAVGLARGIVLELELRVSVLASAGRP